MTTLTCDEARDLLDAGALDALDEPEASALTEHLRGCEPCRRELEQAREAAAMLGLTAPLATMSDTGRERVLQAVRAEPRGRRLPSRWLLGAAAAAVLALAGLGAWNVVLQRQVNDLHGQSARTFDQPTALLALALNPDAKKIDMTGGPAAPGSVGRYVWYQGGPGLLVSQNMPPPPDGQVYALWFVDDTGASVSAGPFTPSGNGQVRFLVPKPPDYFENMVVTVQPQGQTSSMGSQVALDSRAPQS